MKYKLIVNKSASCWLVWKIQYNRLCQLWKFDSFDEATFFVRYYLKELHY